MCQPDLNTRLLIALLVILSITAAGYEERPTGRDAGRIALMEGIK